MYVIAFFKLLNKIYICINNSVFICLDWNEESKSSAQTKLKWRIFHRLWSQVRSQETILEVTMETFH